MFTGIIETIGILDSISKRGNNLDITIMSSISKDLQPDKSVSHNGVCLTITKSNKTAHSATLVNETLNKSNFLTIKKGSIINLERSLLVTDRMDGHFVQGHVDDVARCIEIIDNKKSWSFVFEMSQSFSNFIVEKGSICINGISLTCFGVTNDRFSVAIIPHTYNKTNLKYMKVNDLVNVEFDVVGKYIHKIIKNNI